MADYTSDSLNSTAPWGTGIVTAVIEDGVTSIGTSAFSHCYDLTNITIP